MSTQTRVVAKDPPLGPWRARFVRVGGYEMLTYNTDGSMPFATAQGLEGYIGPIYAESKLQNAVYVFVNEEGESGVTAQHETTGNYPFTVMWAGVVVASLNAAGNMSHNFVISGRRGLDEVRYTYPLGVTPVSDRPRLLFSALPGPDDFHVLAHPIIWRVGGSFNYLSSVSLVMELSGAEQIAFKTLTHSWRFPD